MRPFIPSITLAVLVVATTAFGAPPSHVAWRPVHAFIGSWTGSRSAPDGPLKVVRTYASGTDNRHVRVREKIAGRPDGGRHDEIRFDAERGVLVLRHIVEDGKFVDLALAPVESNATRLVFAGVTDNPGRVRVTVESAGWNAFVERVEHAAPGAEFVVIAETRFRRK